MDDEKGKKKNCKQIFNSALSALLLLCSCKFYFTDFMTQENFFYAICDSKFFTEMYVHIQN